MAEPDEEEMVMYAAIKDHDKVAHAVIALYDHAYAKGFREARDAYAIAHPEIARILAWRSGLVGGMLGFFGALIFVAAIQGRLY